MPYPWQLISINIHKYLRVSMHYLRQSISININKYLRVSFKSLQISICILLIFFPMVAFADEPPCHNQNEENRPGVLNFDSVLNGFVNLANGNFTRAWQDIYIPGRGLSLEIKRTYTVRARF